MRSVPIDERGKRRSRKEEETGTARTENDDCGNVNNKLLCSFDESWFVLQNENCGDLLAFAIFASRQKRGIGNSLYCMFVTPPSTLLSQSDTAQS